MICCYVVAARLPKVQFNGVIQIKLALTFTMSQPAPHKLLADMKKASLCSPVAILVSACALLGTTSAEAQFGNLLQQLQQIQRNAGVPGATPGGAPAGLPAMPGMAPQGGGQNARGRVSSYDHWCNEQSGTLRGMKVDTGVIASEFNVPNLESLQDEFFKALQRTRISRTFPDARFFKASFETKRVRALYDSFLAFPEPDTLAALIQMTRSNDGQEAGDAGMAMVFLHLQAPNLSATPSRGIEWVRRMVGRQHYTAQVFRARVFGFGEMAPKNLNEALGALQAASSLEDQYRNSAAGGIRMEFDPQNYGSVRNATIRDLLVAEPNLPNRRAWEGNGQLQQQIEAAQRAYAQRFPRTALGKTYQEIAAVNYKAIEIGNQLITRSQGGNQLAGQLASLDSLKSSQQGERQTYVYMHPDAQVNQLRMFAKVGQLDPEQRQMLAEAQELRLNAQGMLFSAMSGLIQESAAAFGDFVRMAAPQEAYRTAYDGLIQSCVIATKWEQAMRARDVPSVDKGKVAAEVGRKIGGYKDD